MEYTIERLEKCIDKFNISNTNAKEIVKDIDEDMIPIITELNEKNWITAGCCSGHLKQIKDVGNWSAYICFSNILLKTFPEKPKRVDKDLGVSYNWSGNKNKSIEENEKERKQLMLDLLEWAKSLPVNEDLSGYYAYKEYEKKLLGN